MLKSSSKDFFLAGKCAGDSSAGRKWTRSLGIGLGVAHCPASGRSLNEYSGKRRARDSYTGFFRGSEIFPRNCFPGGGFDSKESVAECSRTNDLTDKSSAMFAHRRAGYSWKEVAGALRVTQAAAKTIFSCGIKHSGSRNVESQPPAIVIPEQRDSGSRKLDKSGAAR